MKKIRKLKRKHLETMLMDHLTYYPAVYVVLSKLSGFPEKVKDVESPELGRNIELLVKGLRWERPGDKK